MNQLEIAIETLERRQLMAGNVTATVNGEDLVLQGDSQGNAVVIHATADADRFLVRGIDGTSINGQDSVRVSGIRDDFRVNLRGGDNQFVLSPLDEADEDVEHPFRITDDLILRTSQGNDLILLGEVTVLGDARIQTGGGDDLVATLHTSFADDVRVKAGGGSDLVFVGDTVVADDLTLNLGSGNDVVLASVYQIGGDVLVSLGGDDDQAMVRQGLVGEDHIVRGGGGTDQLFTSNEDPRMIQGQEQAVSIEADVQESNGALGIRMLGAMLTNSHNDQLDQLVDDHLGGW